MEPVDMGLLDALAKLGKENPEEETWAKLEPWEKFVWMVSLISLPLLILEILTFL